MDAALLGVEKSLNGCKWLKRPAEPRIAEAISQREGVPLLVAQVLAARGVGIEDAATFLDPKLKEQLPDPFHLQDMDIAAERIVAAIMTGEKLAIFGDYDVDGATSSALLCNFFRALGVDVQIYIPDRMKEGYGPNAAALESLKQQGVDLAITVDCGITAFDPLAHAASIGLDVIVVDHHQAEVRLPEAVAVVNPNRIDDNSAHGHMAAVGVSFLVAVAVNKLLRDSGWYEDHNAPNLMQWLDIVALGTVCDVVPLLGVNRALVRQGLKVISQRRNPGLVALADKVGVREQISAFHLGYVMGPRINAGGRVGESSLGARLLTTQDPDEAAVLALRLDEYNAARREVEAQVLIEAQEQVESTDIDPDFPLAFVAGEGWHPGVIGIVAGRLLERYAMPSCVVSIEGGLAKGSARSIPGLDIGAAVIAAREAALLEAGGGHAMAAGFTVTTEKLAEFKAFLGQRLREQVKAGGIVPVLELDDALDVSGATVDVLDTLAMVEPFGAGNAEPKFAITSAQIAFADVVGMGHVRCQLKGAHGSRLKAIAFKAADTDLGVALLNSQGQKMHLAGTIRRDTWQGRNSVQFVIEDGCWA
jgi:single-stranded-DNA-specific exonuclease